MQLFDLEKHSEQEEQQLEQEEYIRLNKILPHGICSYLLHRQFDFLDNDCLKVKFNNKLSLTTINQIIDYYDVAHQLTKEKQTILTQCLYSLSYIHESLKPLKEVLDIDYEISLVGGSIRDFLLNKPIKDLDIVFAISDVKGFAHPSLVQENKHWMVKEYTMPPQELKKLTELEMKNLSDNTPDSFTMKGVWYHLEQVITLLDIPTFYFDSVKKTPKTEQFLFHVLHQLLLKNITVSEYFPPRSIEGDDCYEANSEVWKSGYTNNALRGVIKSQDSRFPYPIDILFVRQHVQTYISSFDFELCKASLTYSDKNIDLLKHFSFYDINVNNNDDNKNIKNNIENTILISAYKMIECSSGFVEDVMHKKLTFLLSNQCEATIEFSLMNHYRRIKNKYPDFNFDFDSISTNRLIREDKKNYIKKLLDYESMHYSLNCHEKINEKRKKI